jgi:repressor LexA
MAITPKQLEILNFISSFTARKGYAPSQSEIAVKFGFKSLGTVQNYLVRLEREGALQKTWNGRRSLAVVPPPQPLPAAALLHSLPLLGQVAAGRPIEAIESHESFDVPASLIKKKGEHFVLKVAGQSMIQDGILDGDFVIVRKQSGAENGQTVVALINNEATVKRYFKRGSHIELRPANDAFQPIIIESWVDFSIEGVVTGVIRQLK